MAPLVMTPPVAPPLSPLATHTTLTLQDRVTAADPGEWAKGVWAGTPKNNSRAYDQTQIHPSHS
jgi:hypothetical protein